MPQVFRMGGFLESISVIQDRVAELLQNVYSDVAADRTWDNRCLRKTNLHMVYL